MYVRGKKKGCFKIQINNYDTFMFTQALYLTRGIMLLPLVNTAEVQILHALYL